MGKTEEEIEMIEKRKDQERDLRRMMRDPRYWRDHDPYIIQRVCEGFKDL